MRTRCNAKPCGFQSQSIIDEIKDKYPEANGNNQRAAEIAGKKLEELWNYMMRVDANDGAYSIKKAATYASDGESDWLAEKNPVNAPSTQKVQNEEDILNDKFFFFRKDFVDGPGNAQTN